MLDFPKYDTAFMKKNFNCCIDDYGYILCRECDVECTVMDEQLAEIQDNFARDWHGNGRS